MVHARDAEMDDVVGDVDRYGAAERSTSRRSVCCAVSIIGTAFFFAFVAYSGTDGLQTASDDDDLPRTSVMLIICCTSIASSLLLAPAFVSRLSPNMALCVAWGSHALYAIANLYPTTATLLPTAFIVGASFPAVGVAQGVYTTALVDRWCGGRDDEDMRVADVDRSETCGCTARTADDRRRRQNLFVFFNSILMVCLHRQLDIGLSVGHA